MVDFPDERLDVRVAREFGLSRRKAQDVIAAGQVDVESERIRDAGHRVAPNVLVTFNPNRRREEAIRLSLPAPFQDETLVVVDKPPGLLSVPTEGGTHDDSVLSRLRKDLERIRGSRAYVGALHRLDRGTSGLLAMALSRECHAAGRAAFRDHAFLRLYLALVEGVPRNDPGTIDLPIADEYQGGKRHIARDDDEPSRHAITHYKVVERFSRASLLEVELDTGRQHQIRLHLRAIGHPIMGDGVYGGKERSGASRPFLHASRLAFPHPFTAQPIDCESTPPRDFAEALRRLRNRAPRR
ncbi:MAG: RluA family pseudouridine synthase [Vicinamibacteria bacterium]|nr:RluA family pseudouridine synthase [Vicinamibacteria bacterium]